MTMKVEHHTLTELQYSEDRRGPWALYLFDPFGFHPGAQWFNKIIRYPAEEITIPEAKQLVDQHESESLEVRVCDGGDNLVYHFVRGKVLFPKDGDFWKEIGA